MYMCVCVRACVCACARVCVCTHIRESRKLCEWEHFVLLIVALRPQTLSLSLSFAFFTTSFLLLASSLTKKNFFQRPQKFDNKSPSFVSLSFARDRSIDRTNDKRERERISRARARKKKDVGLGQRGNREDKVVGRRRRRFFASRFSRARGPAAKRECRCFGTTNRDEDDDGREQVPVAERSGEARRRKEEERHETFAGGVFWNGDGVGANRRRWGVQTIPRRRKRIRPGGRVRAADGAEPRTARGRRNG